MKKEEEEEVVSVQDVHTEKPGITIPDNLWISNGARILKKKSDGSRKDSNKKNKVKWGDKVLVEVSPAPPPPPPSSPAKPDKKLRDALTKAAVPPKRRNQWSLSYRYSWVNGACVLLGEAWCSGLWSVSMVFAWLTGSMSAGFAAFVALSFPVYAVFAASAPAHYAPRFVGSIPMYDLLFRDEKVVGKTRTYTLETRMMCAGRLLAQLLGGIVGGAVLTHGFPDARAFLMAHYQAEVDNMRDTNVQYVFILYVCLYFLCTAVLGGLGLMLRRMTDEERARTSTARLYLMTGIPVIAYLAYPGMGIAFSIASWIWMERVFGFYSTACVVCMHLAVVAETGLAALVEDIIYTSAANNRASHERKQK